MKIVYVSLIADLLHAGHIRILREASKHGKVTVGLLTSTAITELGDIAYLKYQQRLDVLEDLKMVSNVIAQDTASYKKNLLNLKPDFVVHGNDWIKGPQSEYREEVLTLLEEWGGKLIELEYSADISDQNIKNQLMALGITSVTRMQRLKQLVQNKEILLILEAHNALSALIAENMIVDRNGLQVSFDGVWSSSLTDSTSKGKPDIEAVDLTTRLQSINDMLEVTTKPMIYDGDTGGKTEHFVFTVRTLERLGVSAIIIEDKTGLKKNSLFGTEIKQTQDSIENFSNKIKSGKNAQITNDFMIIARIESFILGKTIEDAIRRSKSYVESGADGIMIHSKENSGHDIRSFCENFRKFNKETPIIVVPSTFNHIKETEFIKWGINVVIYANQMLRSSYPSMLNVAKSILKNERSSESDDLCLPIKEILNLIPGTK